MTPGSQRGSQEVAAAMAGTVRVIDVNAVGDPTMMIFHKELRELLPIMFGGQLLFTLLVTYYFFKMYKSATWAPIPR